MNDIEKLGKELLSGGNAGVLRALAGTPEAKKLGAVIDPRDVQAAKNGDMDALRGMLGKVMATDEGKKLASQLSEMFGNNK